MAIQCAVEGRNAKLNALITEIGAAPLLRAYSGPQPATTATAAAGTLLAEAVLPSTWMLAASGGSIAKTGTWSDLVANASGRLAHWRIYNAADTRCYLQGTITLAGDGGDMTVNIIDTDTSGSGTTFTVMSFALTEAND